MAAWIVLKTFFFKVKVLYVVFLWIDIFFHKCPSISNSIFFALLHGKVVCIAYILAGI